MEILKLSPALKDYLWGGTKLKTQYGKNSDLDIVAESWELSSHPDGMSKIVNGEFRGKTFGEYLISRGKAVLGYHGKEMDQFPILIKFIDAKQALSIQVHPDDNYAWKNEGESGKNEMWYIMDCEPEAFLYYGVNRELTKEEFRRHIEEGTLPEVLNKVRVQKGDSFFIPAGTIHAIGAGNLICEIQQNSNSTYRVFDYNRTDKHGNKRELHIDKAVDVAVLKPCEKQYSEGPDSSSDNGDEILNKCQYFSAKKMLVKSERRLNADSDSFHSIIVLDGQGYVTGGKQEIEIKKGDCLFVPAGFGEYLIGGENEIILTTI